MTMAPGANEMVGLNQNLLERIECPACLDYMKGAIYLCSKGHSTCGKCRLMIANCPICRARMTMARNYTMESFAELLFYPCKFDGCNEYINIKKYPQHTATCRHRLYPCLLKIDGARCPWTGQYHAIEEHANAMHEGKAWMQEENLDRWKDGLDKDDVQLIRAYDRLFYIFRSCIQEGNNPSKAMMYWSMQLIGPQEEAANFGYMVNIYCENSHRDMRFSEICHNDTKTMSSMIESGECVAVPMKSLRTFHNSYNSVWFRVKVKELAH